MGNNKARIKSNLCINPAYILWVTVTAAIIWFSAVILPASIAKNAATGVTLLVIEIVMLIMNVIFIIDFMKSRKEASKA